MMRYRIANNIIFDPAERTLTMDGHDDSVHLSIPASRLLAFMLKRKDVLHERDALLTEVWDKYGLKGSGSNLNQYISLLRRTLSGMDCDEFFITVPKVGFKVNPAIEISIIEDLPAEPVPASRVIVRPHPQALSRRAQLNFSSKIVFSLLVFILMVMALYIYGKKNDWRANQVDPVHGQLGKSCSIVYLNKANDAVKEKINMKAMAYLEERGRTCSDGDFFIASIVNVEQSSGISRSFLSLCRGDHQGKIVDCNSLYSRR